MPGKLLIADASACADVLARKALSMGLAVQICADGSRVIDQLQQFHPDVLVLDLMMPQLDGLSILARMEEQNLHPACMVTTGFVSAYVEQQVTDLGADYMMRKPFDFEAAMDRVLDLLEQTDNAPPLAPRAKTEFSERLLALGFSPKRRGFHYLDTALVLLRENPNLSVTKELYPMVARQFQTTHTSVERAIRTVIQDCWNHCDMKIWRQYFSATPSGYVPRPTNSGFLFALMESNSSFTPFECPC